MTTTQAIKPDLVIPPQLTSPATWVPVVHALVAAILGAAAFVLPGNQPAWVAPLLLLVGAVVFVAGVFIYLWHRDHWTKASADVLFNWAKSQLPALQSDVTALKAALPADLVTRLSLVESTTSRLPVLERAVESLRGLFQAPAPPVAPVAAAPPPVSASGQIAAPGAVEGAVAPAATLP